MIVLCTRRALLSSNETPAGFSESRCHQIKRGLITLNTPHFTASHSFAAKHCCGLGARYSDWASACPAKPLGHTLVHVVSGRRENSVCRFGLNRLPTLSFIYLGSSEESEFSTIVSYVSGLKQALNIWWRWQCLWTRVIISSIETGLLTEGSTGLDKAVVKNAVSYSVDGELCIISNKCCFAQTWDIGLQFSYLNQVIIS